MGYDLEGVTDRGRTFVDLCEQHVSSFWQRAPEHDRAGTFPHGNIADLVTSGVIAAVVPEAFGGLGVTRVGDLAAGLARIGRGDGSTGLALNMHLTAIWSMARAWRVAEDAKAPHAAPLAEGLRDVVAGRRIVSVLATEAGTPIMNPMTTAVHAGDGWRISGRKHFATGTPAATHLALRLRYQDDHGAWRFGGVTIAKASSGVQVLENWDAMGMRGSGSGEVVLTDVAVPMGAVIDGGPWGVMSPAYMTAASSALITILAVFLGIAERAAALARDHAAKPGRATIPAIRHLIAENEIDILAARGTLHRCAEVADAAFAAHQLVVPSGAAEPMFAECQGAKIFVMRTAIAIVDRAMTIVGGGGFMQGHPMSRLYRDVRAGPFMQPYSPIEGFDLIGRVALGQPLQGETGT